MKADTAIRTVAFVGVSCFVVWRVTPLLDKLSAMSEGLDADSLSALLDAHGRDAPSEPDAASGLVVYSPKGDALTEEERQRLLDAAARRRPRVPDAETGRRVSLPGHDLSVPQPADQPASLDLESLIDPAAVEAVLRQIEQGGE